MHHLVLCPVNHFLTTSTPVYFQGHLARERSISAIKKLLSWFYLLAKFKMQKTNSSPFLDSLKNVPSSKFRQQALFEGVEAISKISALISLPLLATMLYKIHKLMQIVPLLVGVEWTGSISVCSSARTTSHGCTGEFSSCTRGSSNLRRWWWWWWCSAPWNRLEGQDLLSFKTPSPASTSH